MTIIGDVIGGIILNYTGATLRWIYGSLWRTIFKKPKFTYGEYVNGPKNPKDNFDIYAHRLNNRLIGLIGLFAIGFLVVGFLQMI